MDTCHPGSTGGWLTSQVPSGSTPPTEQGAELPLALAGFLSVFSLPFHFAEHVVLNLYTLNMQFS